MHLIFVNRTPPFNGVFGKDFLLLQGALDFAPGKILSADHSKQKRYRHCHHDHLRHRLGPDHAAEAEEIVQKQKERYIQKELSHQRDGKGILGLAHGLKGHAAHGNRPDEGQDAHDRSQYTASRCDDLRGICENPDQLRNYIP